MLNILFKLLNYSKIPKVILFAQTPFKNTFLN